MLAGAEFGSHLLKCCLGERYERVSAAQPAPRGPFYLLEHRHALAEIAARGAVVPAEGLAVTLLLSRGANFLLEDSEGKSPLSLVHEWCHGEMWELWKDFLFKYYKLHVDLLVFGRAGPRRPRRLVTEFLATWPTYED